MDFIKFKVADPGGEFSEIYIKASEIIAAQSLAARHIEPIKNMGHTGIENYCLIVMKTPMPAGNGATSTSMVISDKITNVMGRLSRRSAILG